MDETYTLAFRRAEIRAETKHFCFCRRFSCAQPAAFPSSCRKPPSGKVGKNRSTNPYGCGSKLNERRGKLQVLVHISTYPGFHFGYRLFEPQPYMTIYLATALKKQTHWPPKLGVLPSPFAGPGGKGWRVSSQKHHQL